MVAHLRLFSDQTQGLQCCYFAVFTRVGVNGLRLMIAGLKVKTLDETLDFCVSLKQSFSVAVVFFSSGFGDWVAVANIICASLQCGCGSGWVAVAPPDRYLHAASMLPPAPYWASGATPELLANERWRKKMPGLHEVKCAQLLIRVSQVLPSSDTHLGCTHRGGGGCRGLRQGTD